MATMNARFALALLTASFANSAAAADRYYCDANVTCTFDKGCQGWDIPWVINLWKEGDTWLATEQPDGGTPVVFTEIARIRSKVERFRGQSDAIHFQRVWREGDQQGVVMLTILPDLRMIQSWQDRWAWSSDSNEHTILGRCYEEEE